MARVRAALVAGDLSEVGRLLTESHHSSRTQFENSTPELDFLVETLTATPHVLWRAADRRRIWRRGHGVHRRPISPLRRRSVWRTPMPAVLAPDPTCCIAKQVTEREGSVHQL